MLQTTTKLICDICGNEIKKEEIPFSRHISFYAKRITIADGIFGRPYKIDLCSSCFQNMKKFCKSKKGSAE